MAGLNRKAHGTRQIRQNAASGLSLDDTRLITRKAKYQIMEHSINGQESHFQ
jgi:hypothetical protein